EAQRATRLQRLPAESLQRFAKGAAKRRDEQDLWDLMRANLTRHEPGGGAASEHTMRAYRRGLRELLVMWQDEDVLKPSRDAGSRYAKRLQAGDRAAVLEAEPSGSRRGRSAKPGPLSPATVNLRIAAARALYDA